jgi:hypothetical protein
MTAENQQLPNASRHFCNKRLLFQLLKDGLTRARSGLWRPRMTLRIEKSFEGGKTIFRVSGGIGSEQLEELKAEMAGEGAAAVLDLEHVTLVDVEGVRFLSDCEGQGIELLHCPLYIREWIGREQARSRDSSERGSPL